MRLDVDIANRLETREMKNMLQDAIAVVTKVAQNKYDTKKLDQKIISLEKKQTDQLLKLGSVVYESRINGTQIESDVIDRLCKEIEQLQNKKVALVAQRPKKQSVEKIQKPFNEQKETVYATLNRKENDLKIQRTAEGLKFLKFCPHCQTANDPDTSTCVSCGHQFR